MRTLILIATGLGVVALLLWRTSPARHHAAAGLFTVVWLVVVGWNLSTGLAHGYTLGEELPIHLVLFGVPVIAAWAWIGLRRPRARRSDH